MTQQLDNLMNAMIEDILNASDEDILEEFREDGGDPEQYAAEMRARFEQAVIRAKGRPMRIRKKVVGGVAVQWTKDGDYSALKVTFYPPIEGEWGRSIRTAKGRELLKEGDWIAVEDDGSVHLLTPEQFVQIYEAA